MSKPEKGRGFKIEKKEYPKIKIILLNHILAEKLKDFGIDFKYLQESENGLYWEIYFEQKIDRKKWLEIRKAIKEIIEKYK